MRGEPAEHRGDQRGERHARPGRALRRGEEVGVMGEVERDEHFERPFRRAAGPVFRQWEHDRPPQPAVAVAIQLPARLLALHRLPRALRGGEVRRMDQPQHAPVDVAHAHTHIVVADERGLHRIQARGQRRGGVPLAQRVADQHELAVQLVHVELVEVRVEHAPVQQRGQHQQGRGERGEERRQAGGQRAAVAHRGAGSTASST